MRKRKWLSFKEMENSIASTKTIQQTMLGLLNRKEGTPRNIKIRGSKKQKAIRQEFQKLVRLELARLPCPRLLWTGPSRNPAKSSSTSQTHGFR